VFKPGAKIFYKCRAVKILEENGRAVGIQLADGKEIRGNYVISAADLRTTLYDMLEGKHIDPIHQELFQRCKLIPSMVQVSFGVNMDLSSQPECLGDCYKASFLKDWKAGLDGGEELLFRPHPSSARKVCCGNRFYN